MTLLPIVEREMRVASRKRGTYWLRSLAALCVLALGTLIFLVAVFHQTSSPVIGKIMFISFCVITLLFAGLSGVMLTSDCLSEEKREGTMGLLFLTDLRGFDIVLGKLAATSLQAVYGFLAIAPILAVPILFGGISGSLYGWALLLMAATVFLSLSAGMFASSLGRKYRNAMGGTLLIMLAMAALPMVIYIAVSNSLSKPASTWIASPSPIFALVTLLMNKFPLAIRIPWSMSDFWRSLEVIAGMGAFFMVMACLILPLVWRMGASAAPKMPRTEKSRRRRVRRRKISAEKRAGLLSPNPFYWLAIREQLVGWQGGIAFGLVAATWVYFFVQYWRDDRQYANYEFLYNLTVILPILLKFIGTAASTIRLGEDRRSGALELLLVTPLAPEEIFKGQRRAFFRQFQPFIWYFMAMYVGDLVCMWINYFPNQRETWLQTQMIYFSSTVTLLWLDFYAMAWVGMWAAVHNARQNRAASATFTKVILIPWLALFIGFIIVQTCDIDGKVAEYLYYSWLVLCGIYDLWLVWRAKRRLRRDFRHAAAGTLGENKRRWFQPRLKPAAA